MCETIIIDGYTVDAKRADEFYNGGDGSRVTDAQWDESKRRAHAGPQQVDVAALWFDHVGECCPLGDVIAGGDHE